MISKYYYLTKPGIIYGNLLTAAGGFLLASKGHIYLELFVATLTGISLVIASACVLNNYIDRDIDKLMSRTKKRALVEGSITGWVALIYGCLLGIVGFALLSSYTNGLVIFIGAAAFFDYIVLYGIYKRRSTFGTMIGSIAGAAPVVAGYCAVTDRFDKGALFLFLVLVFWQMSHFYAIAMYRIKDYRAAGIPVLPIIRGSTRTKSSIIAYIVGFIGVMILLTIYKYTGYIFLGVMLILAGAWLYFGVNGYRAQSNLDWAKKMFKFSLIVITGLSLMLCVASFLP